MKRSPPSLDETLTRRAREARALQDAWAERAQAHELLTLAGLKPGTLPERVADLLGELHEARALLTAIARGAAPTPIDAAASREETAHAKAR